MQWREEQPGVKAVLAPLVRWGGMTNEVNLHGLRRAVEPAVVTPDAHHLAADGVPGVGTAGPPAAAGMSPQVGGGTVNAFRREP